MNDFPWVIIGIIVGLIATGILIALVLKRRRASKPIVSHYRALFVLGITFIPLGIIYEIVFFVSGTKVFLVLGFSFIAMGLSYVAISLASRNK